MTTDLVLRGEIAKFDADKQMVWGWASIYERDGQVVIDHQDDMIHEEDIVEAAHSFVSDARVGKAMHSGDQIGEIVESVVLTRDLQKVLGIDLKMAGWLIGMHVQSPEVWSKVKDGTLKSFSIGALVERIPV
jgi:hypothetical protein